MYFMHKILHFVPFMLQTVALWDLRNLKLKLHSFESHKDEIFQVSLPKKWECNVGLHTYKLGFCCI